MFQDIIKYVEELSNNKDANSKNFERGILICLNEITYCLILKMWRLKSEISRENIQNMIKGKSEEEKEDILERLIIDIPNTAEFTYSLNKAEENALKTMKLSEKLNPSDELRITIAINLACIFIEKGEYENAYEILAELESTPYVVENVLGSVLNEISLIKVHQ